MNSDQTVQTTHERGKTLKNESDANGAVVFQCANDSTKSANNLKKTAGQVNTATNKPKIDFSIFEEIEHEKQQKRAFRVQSDTRKIYEVLFTTSLLWRDLLTLEFNSGFNSLTVFHNKRKRVDIECALTTTREINKKNFEPFDLVTLIFAQSLQAQGASDITTNQIFKHLTGRTRAQNSNNAAIYRDIEQSLELLNSTEIQIKYSDYRDFKRLKDTDKIEMLNGRTVEEIAEELLKPQPLLYTTPQLLRMRNGDILHGYHIENTPPLFAYAATVNEITHVHLPYIERLLNGSSMTKQNAVILLFILWRDRLLTQRERELARENERREKQRKRKKQLVEVCNYHKIDRGNFLNFCGAFFEHQQTKKRIIETAQAIMKRTEHSEIFKFTNNKKMNKKRQKGGKNE